MWSACAAVFAVTLAYRFLSLTGFTDDHHVHVAAAWQILAGDWPTRDFVDPGMPLMYVASAAVQAVAGGGLLSELILVAAAFAAAAAITLHLTWKLTGSAAAAAAATALQVTIYPRTYSYPKVLLYVLGAAAMVAYCERPTVARLVALAAIGVAAFLFRHDHGLFIGAAGLVAVALAPHASAAARVRAVAVYAAAVVMLAVPYLAYLAANGGVGGYVATAAAFSRAEAERNPPVMARFITAPADMERGCAAGVLACAVRANALAALYYAFYALPLAAVLIARPEDRPVVIPLAVLALVVNLSFLRDALRARLADVVAPASVLLALVLERLWTRRESHALTLAARSIAAAGCAALLTSAVVFGETGERLETAGLTEGPAAVAERFRHQVRSLLAPREDPRGHSSRLVTGLAPHFDYMDRCLASGQRLFVPGFAPDVFVYARRPFAGGNLWIMPGYFESHVFQSDVVARLDRQAVPLAVVRLPAYEEIARKFPVIDEYLHRHFRPLMEAPLTDGDSVRILANHSLPAAVDARTGWPCYR